MYVVAGRFLRWASPHCSSFDSDSASHDENRKLAEAERNACESMVAQFITNEHKELEFQDAAVARECCAILKVCGRPNASPHVVIDPHTSRAAVLRTWQDSIRRAVYAAADASTAADMLRTRLEENRIVLRQQQQTIAQYLYECIHTFMPLLWRWGCADARLHVVVGVQESTSNGGRRSRSRTGRGEQQQWGWTSLDLERA